MAIGAGRVDPPLTGRAGERQVLREAVRRAAGGQAQVVALGGHPGIGKTRLAREGLALAADAGFTVLTGVAGPLDGDLSLAPVVEALRPLVGTGTALGDGLADLARLFDGLGLSAPADLGDPRLERTRLFEAVRRLLDRATRTRPVAVLLDDVHWADAATLALVQYLGRGLADRRFLLLLTHRTGGPEAAATAPLIAALRRVAGFTELSLGGLADPDVAALAAAVVDGPVPPALTRMLVERSAGVPLFVTEIVGSLLGSGALRRNGETWELDDERRGALPAAVTELMRERIDSVPAPAREVLDVIALSPGAVGHDLVAAVLGESRTLDGVAALHAVGLLAEEESVDGVAYRTAHPLLAEVAHARLPGVVRRRRHADLVRALRAEGAGGAGGADGRMRDGRELSRLAHHVRGAGSELAADEALDVLVPAAADALRRRAGEEATAIARAALDRMPATDDGTDPRRIALLETLATAAELTGDSAVAARAWAEAADAAAAAGAPPQTRAEHLRRAGSAVWNLGAFADAWNHLGAAEDLLAGVPPGPVHLAVQETRTGLASRCGDDVLERESRRLEDLIAVIGADQGRLLSLYARVVLMIRYGELDDAVPLVTRLYAMAEERDDDLLRERVRRPGAQVAFNRGDLHAAEKDSLDGLRYVERIGVPTVGGSYLLYLTLLGQFRGDLAAADRWYARLAELAQAGRFDRGILARDAARGLGLVLRGRSQEALDLVAEVRAEHGHWSQADRHAFSPIEYVECAALLQAGDPAAARASVERSLAPGTAMLGVSLGVLAEACARTGDRVAARATLDRMRRVGPAAPWPSASVLRAEAVLRAAEGDPAGAAARYSAAADAFARLGIRPLEVTNRLDGATVMLDAGLHDEGTSDTVREMLARAERIEAAHDAARARALLRRLGVHPSRPAARPAAGAVAGAVTDLSPREAEVARLVAEGLTNAEVSQRLFISPRTVTTHLQNIYARLGISSRTALARYVADRASDT